MRGRRSLSASRTANRGIVLLWCVVTEGTKTHSCRPCDYDLCEECFSKQTQQEEGQEQERRRAQANGGGAGAEEASSAAVTVKQFSIDVRPVQVAIDPASGGNGHRRAQANSCSQSDIATRTQAINTACCNEEGEDCSGGLPRNCNADCADTLMPFWEQCQADLGAERATFEEAADLCRRSSPSLAEDVWWRHATSWHYRGGWIVCD